jgi:hypothetical protein
VAAGVKLTHAEIGVYGPAVLAQRFEAGKPRSIVRLNDPGFDLVGANKDVHAHSSLTAKV